MDQKRDLVLPHAYSLSQRQLKNFPVVIPKFLCLFMLVPSFLAVLDLSVWLPPFVDTVTYENNKLLHFHVVDLYIRIYL
jgi:hypothetical protein